MYSIYGMKNTVGNVGHSAHLGGAIGGFVFTLLLFPEVLSRKFIMIIFLSFTYLISIIFGNKNKRIKKVLSMIRLF